MSPQMEQFKAQVLQDPALQEQLKSVKSPQEFVNLAIQLAQERGFNFTVSEVEAALASSTAELSDEQLETMAGGGTLSKGYSAACESGARPF